MKIHSALAGWKSRRFSCASGTGFSSVVPRKLALGLFSATLLLAGGTAPLHSSSGNSPAGVKQKSAAIQTETVEKLIVAGGSATIEIDLGQLNNVGFATEQSKPLGPEPLSPELTAKRLVAEELETLRFALAPDSFFTIVVANDVLRGPLPGSIQLIPQNGAHLPALLNASLHQLVLEKMQSEEAYDLVVRDSKSGFVFFNVTGHHYDYDSDTRSFRLTDGLLLISDEFASQLGRSRDASAVTGKISITATMLPIEMRTIVNGEIQSTTLPPLRGQLDLGSPNQPEAVTSVPGPDVIVGDLPAVTQPTGTTGINGSFVGLGVGTTSCNNGDQEFNWFALPNNDHPVIPQNLYRMSGGASNDDRFEQIGQSWLKHAFQALQNDFCGFGCVPHPTPTPPSDGTHLGVGCSDPYSSTLNYDQTRLGSRAWVNPFTGFFPRGDSATPPNDHTGHTHTGTSHRLTVAMSDLDTTLNTGATYFAEGQYVTPHEYAWCQAHAGQCNMYNNVSYRQFGVSSTNQTNFTFSPVGSTVRMQPAIKAWTGATINQIEPAPGVDGIAFVGCKVTNPSAGVWHYEYAVYNQNLDRAIRSFSVPLNPGVNVSNIGFHAPAQEPAWANDGTVGNAGFSSTPWTSTQTSSSLTWSSETFGQNQNANAIRWGTLYNLRFDANGPPQTANATLGFFKTGANSTVGVQVPSSPLVVISQVFGGGGETGAPLRNDFIEVFNRGTTSVNISGWSVQYAAATSTSWSVTPLCPSGPCTLAPGQYFLVQEASSGAVGASLPVPDVIGTINMAATVGKVALVINTLPSSGSSCPYASGVVDFIGYGLTASCAEGAKAPAPSNTTADLRAGGGCIDTDNNASDFAVGPPTPRNSSTIDPCIVPTPTPSPTPTATATTTATATATPMLTATPTPLCANPTKTFPENFDGVTPPALPAGWVAANAVDTDGILWVTSDSGTPTPSADSLPNSAYINDPAAVNDKRLDSPSIAIVGPAQLSFSNNYNLEAGISYYDGGVLEISIGGGGFTDIITAGGTFVAGGYNGTISTAYGNPIAGRMAWSGNSAGFISTVINLPATANGQNINLRWRMGSDSSVSRAGWRIDNVSILDCLPVPTPTPTPMPGCGDTVSLSALKDNTLYEDASGQLSNGSGIYLFTGQTDGTALRRGLIAFDLSSIPNNATITGATLSMFLSRSGPNSAGVSISLNRMLSDWGEGASNAGSPGGQGAPPQTGDATWFHTFYNTSFWTNPGGDFSATISATTPVGPVNTIHTWSGSGLIADVQSWVSTPASNFGWIILADEVDLQSAQRLNTRENSSNPPQLTVSYQVPCETPTPTPTPTPAPPVSISGTVIYCSNPAMNPVPGVTMTLTGHGGGSTTTDGSGSYSFTGLTSGNSYTVTPSKARLSPGSSGITTVDVIAVQRHFLNLGTPLSGCRLTAADVNSSSSIDTVDVIAIQRFFLGLTTGTASVGKYLFNPLSRSYAGIVSDQTGQNYDALIFGDVASGYVH